MNRAILNFDMDDTLVATKPTLLRLSYERAVELGNKQLANIFKETVYLGKDITELDKSVQDFVEQEVIVKRTYMDISNPRRSYLPLSVCFPVHPVWTLWPRMIFLPFSPASVPMLCRVWSF